MTIANAAMINPGPLERVQRCKGRLKRLADSIARAHAAGAAERVASLEAEAADLQAELDAMKAAAAAIDAD